MLVAITQPEHLPWLGFLDKARQSDVLVLLDTVPFRKRYFQNRNRICDSTGAVWLTVPVLTRGRGSQPISEVEIDATSKLRWREKYWGRLEGCYAGTPFWKDYADDLHAALWMDTSTLAVLNERLIQLLLGWFDIPVKTVRSSELGVSGTSSALLVDICRRLDADRYLSGVSGRDYLDLKLFETAGVHVEFQEFHHPIYTQRYVPFVPCMSAVDLLFNHGEKSGRVLRGVGVEVMAEVIL